MAWKLLVRAWIFADKYLMPALQNKTMSTLIERNNKLSVIPTDCLKLVYDNTLPGSPLRRLFLDLVAYRGNLADIMSSTKCQHWPHEALVELVKAFGAKRREDGHNFELPEERKGKCYYHVHKNDERC